MHNKSEETFSKKLNDYTDIKEVSGYNDNLPKKLNRFQPAT